MSIRSLMSSIIRQIEPEHHKVFALEFGKMAESDFVYTFASTNISQSTPNLVKLYVTMRSRMKSIMDLIGPKLSYLHLNLQKLVNLTSLYTLSSAAINQSVPNLVTIYIPIRSWMSLIMGQMEPKHPELFALECGKMAEFDMVYTRINKYQPITTKLGKNVCDHKMSNEFDHGSNRTKTELFVLEFAKLAESDFTP